jgi:hypothetical protein
MDPKERQHLLEESDYWFRHATELHAALSRVWACAKYYDSKTLEQADAEQRSERAECALQRIRTIIAEAIKV